MLSWDDYSDENPIPPIPESIPAEALAVEPPVETVKAEPVIDTRLIGQPEPVAVRGIPDSLVQIAQIQRPGFKCVIAGDRQKSEIGAVCQNCQCEQQQRQSVCACA